MKAAYRIHTSEYGEVTGAIGSVLWHMGFNAKYHGFDCIMKAMDLINKDGSYLDKVCSRLYPDVAEAVYGTPAGVERSIRYAIMKAYEATKFDGVFPKCPTNKDLLAYIYRVRVEQ